MAAFLLAHLSDPHLAPLPRPHLSDLIGKARPGTPSVWDFKAMADEGSMLNTPPTFGWYFAGLVFKWLKSLGGLAAMGERNRLKADTLYRAIDDSGFYRNPVSKNARSWMNIPFRRLSFRSGGTPDC